MAGRTLAQGLMAARGEQLRLIYVLVMETGIFGLLANKTKDFFNKEINHAQQQLEREIARLESVDDNQLRLELFLHMTKEFELPGGYYNTSMEIENKCGEILRKAHADQLHKDKKFKDFVLRNGQLSMEKQLALYQMQKIVESLGSEFDQLTADEQEHFAEQIEGFIGSLPNEQQEIIKEKLHIDTMTNSAIKKVIATQGSAVLLAVIVEIAGFAAYTILTSLIAGTAGLIGLTLPFGVYMTATSLLSILTGPVGLILIGGAGGVMMLTQHKKVKRTLLQMGIVQLMLPVILDDSQVYPYDSLIQAWSKHYQKQLQLLDSISQGQKEQERMSKVLAVIKEKLELHYKQLTDCEQAYNQMVDQLVHSLSLVKEEEMTDSFKKRKVRIAVLKEEIRTKNEAIARNKRKKSLMDKIGAMFSNLSLENEIRKRNNEIRALEREQALELITLAPVPLKSECLAAQAILDEKKTILENIDRYSKSKRSVEEHLAVKQNTLNQMQAELHQLQKEIHGLGDLV